MKPLFDFFSKLGEYADPGPEGAGSRYYRFIIVFAGISGLVVSAIYTWVIFSGWADGQSLPLRAIFAPAIFFAIGAVGAVSVSCAFAPSSFLQGPGKKWMRLIGTEKLVVARIACGLLSALFLGFIALTIFSAWSDHQRGLL